MTETAQQQRIEKLREIPLFEQLSEEALQAVLDRAAEFEARPNHVLVEPNQPGAGLFVIEEGTVTVELPGLEKEMGPGEFFGELALLREDHRHTARVTTATDVRCLAIRRDDFDALLEEEPSIAVTMLRTVAKRLADRG
jgi:CRP-like cAMP-binding protein